MRRFFGLENKKFRLKGRNSSGKIFLLHSPGFHVFFYLSLAFRKEFLISEEKVVAENNGAMSEAFSPLRDTLMGLKMRKGMKMQMQWTARPIYPKKHNYPSDRAPNDLSKHNARRFLAFTFAETSTAKEIRSISGFNSSEICFFSGHSSEACSQINMLESVLKMHKPINYAPSLQRGSFLDKRKIYLG